MTEPLYSVRARTTAASGPWLLGTIVLVAK
jgi:hypothetical protein